MLRTKLSSSRFLPAVAACCALMMSSSASAAPPRAAGGGEPDYEASGFVVPAGYAGPAAGSGVIPAGAPYGQTPMYPVAQAGFFGGGGGGPIGGGCDGSCDGSCGGTCQGGLFGGPGIGSRLGLTNGGGLGGGCGLGSCGFGGGCGLGCGLGGGLLGRLSGGCSECGSCGSGLLGCHGGGVLNRLRSFCIFCQGSGCGVCQSFGRGYLRGALAALAPYTEGGIGVQRWYDVSAEALFLSLDTDRGGRPVTSLGPGGPIVLSTDDARSSGLEAGVRLSAAMICGAGGNVEVTYMGLQEFGGSASVRDDDANLYSFISEFGTAPVGGYDDTDRSVFQGLDLESRFHSGEVNYRRRWVGPYQRFQGSWLAGIRYVEFSEEALYHTVGLNNDTAAADDLRFFNGNFNTRNAMTGFQTGGDLWWNIYPGINLGLGLKGAVLGNRSKLDTSLVSNSIGPGGVAFPLGYSSSDSDSRTAWLTEFNATAIYRLSYSWAFRTSYYVVNVDNVALGLSALESPEVALAIGNDPFTVPDVVPVNNDDSFTVQGISFGAEYLW